MVFLFEAWTEPSLLSWRFRLAVFFSRMWLLLALRRMILPVPVVLKRFFAPLCVFIFGIAATSFAFLHTRFACRVIFELGATARFEKTRGTTSRPEIGSALNSLRQPPKGDYSALLSPSGASVAASSALSSTLLSMALVSAASEACSSASRSDFQTACAFLSGPKTMIMFRPSCLG